MFWTVDGLEAALGLGFATLDKLAKNVQCRLTFATFA
jgi:hypothetical protein